jgi:hypothetical protein
LLKSQWYSLFAQTSLRFNLELSLDVSRYIQTDVSTFSFTVPRRGPDVSDVTGQHGLDHPSVVIDLPELVCECKFSRRTSASSIEASACREKGEVYWMVSVRGLIIRISF